MSIIECRVFLFRIITCNLGACILASLVVNPVVINLLSDFTICLHYLASVNFPPSYLFHCFFVGSFV